MKGLRVFTARLAGLFGRKRSDVDLDEEVNAHLEMLANDYRQQGLTPEEALEAARRDFGDIHANKETYRDARSFPALEALARDARQTVRQLAHTPAFLITVILILGIGIGANTAIFSVVNSVLLRALPYENADRLAFVWEYSLRQKHINTVAAANLADWKSQNRAFEDLAYSWDEQYVITGGGAPETLIAYRFSTNFFRVLGARPLIGRTFASDEGQPGRDHVALLSYPLWQRRFGGDSGILNRQVTLNGETYTVIGVMPPSFNHPSPITQLWTPLPLSPAGWNDRSNHVLRVVGRLRPGVTLEQAQSQMNAIAARLAKLYPKTNDGMSVQVMPLRDTYVGDLRTTLWVLQSAVLVLLLIACANVANLLLARGMARQREVAVRAALGASGWRLFQQFLVEGLALSAGGAVLGILLAEAGVRLLPTLLPKNRMFFDPAAVTINGPVLLFSLIVAVCVGTLFGTAQSWRIVPNGVLKEGSRGSTAGIGKTRLRAALIVSEVALSLVLLVGAGLLMRTFLQLVSRSLGIRPDHVVTGRISLPPNKYPDGRKVNAFLQQVLVRLHATPGISAAAAVNTLPLTGQYALRTFALADRPAEPRGQEAPACFQMVTPEYFSVMGIPLREGRMFDVADRPGAPEVVLVSESFAHRYWADSIPIGKRIQIADGGTPEWRTIIGVVGDIRQFGLETDPSPTVYRPFAQAYWPFLTLVVRTSGDPAQFASAIRHAVWQVDKNEPVDAVESMEEVAADALAMRRLSTALLGVFSAIALLLTALGIYGVISYGVQQRTNEIGVRMALGATVRDIVRLVLRQAMMLTFAGAAIGIAGAWGVTRYLRSMLVNVSPTDPLTMISVLLLLLAVSAAASFMPAHRAAHIDPAVTLRRQ